MIDPKLITKIETETKALIVDLIAENDLKFVLILTDNTHQSITSNTGKGTAITILSTAFARAVVTPTDSEIN